MGIFNNKARKTVIISVLLILAATIGLSAAQYKFGHHVLPETCMNFDNITKSQYIEKDVRSKGNLDFTPKNFEFVSFEKEGKDTDIITFYMHGLGIKQRWIAIYSCKYRSITYNMGEVEPE